MICKSLLLIVALYEETQSLDKWDFKGCPLQPSTEKADYVVFYRRAFTIKHLSHCTKSKVLYIGTSDAGFSFGCLFRPRAFRVLILFYLPKGCYRWKDLYLQFMEIHFLQKSFQCITSQSIFKVEYCQKRQTGNICVFLAFDNFHYFNNQFLPYKVHQLNVNRTFLQPTS